MKFSENLYKLRIENGWTQQELADRLGISRSAVGMYERNSRVPDFELLEKIADLFNVNMSFLLGYESLNYEKIPTSAPILPDERMTKIIQLVALLSDQEKDMIIAQLKGILAMRQNQSAPDR